MNLKHHQYLAFFGAALITFAAWMIFRTKEHRSQPPAHTVENVRAHEPRFSLRDLPQAIADLEKSDNQEARLKAAARLNEIQTSDIPEALAPLKLIDGKKLTLAAKVLLIRWAASDGEAAANWAWKKLGPENLWTEAFKEIGPSWAWNHPTQFAEWTAEHMDPLPRMPTPPSAADIADEETPLLDTLTISSICLWLAPRDPQAAYKTLIAREGYNSEDRKIADVLDTVPQIELALTNFDHLDQLVSGVYGGSQVHCMYLFMRWREIDPEGFAASPYKHLFDTGNAPIKETPASDLKNFEEWNRVHPGVAPDMSRWPAVKQEAWKDFEVIGPGPL